MTVVVHDDDRIPEYVLATAQEICLCSSCVASWVGTTTSCWSRRAHPSSARDSARFISRQVFRFGFSSRAKDELAEFYKTFEN
jgi:hypothetical protein